MCGKPGKVRKNGSKFVEHLGGVQYFVDEKVADQKRR
jgi:hypothetical protein